MVDYFLFLWDDSLEGLFHIFVKYRLLNVQRNTISQIYNKVDDMYTGDVSSLSGSLPRLIKIKEGRLNSQDSCSDELTENQIGGSTKRREYV